HSLLVFTFFFFLMILQPPSSPLFPYTTLFRSVPSDDFSEHQRTFDGVVRLIFTGSLHALAMLVGLAIGGIGHRWGLAGFWMVVRSEEHTSELQSLAYLVCRLLLEKKKNVHYSF